MTNSERIGYLAKRGKLVSKVRGFRNTVESMFSPASRSCQGAIQKIASAQTGMGIQPIARTPSQHDRRCIALAPRLAPRFRQRRSRVCPAVASWCAPRGRAPQPMPI
jgi:hypothetical protein